MKNFTIHIASDHAGFDLKQFLISKFSSEIEIIDLGCFNNFVSVDYPDYAKKIAEKIDNDQNKFGILICGSGIGISIAANRFNHIRAALCFDETSAQLSREHNDANIICLGARIIDQNTATKIVKKFLTSEFLGGRHDIRVKKLG